MQQKKILLFDRFKRRLKRLRDFCFSQTFSERITAIAAPSWASPQKKMLKHFLHSAPTAERTYEEEERVNPVTTGVGDAPRRKMFGKTKCCGLRYFSYSIPLACVMTLLVGIIYATCFILPTHQAYAIEPDISPLAASYTALTIGGDALDRQVTVAPGSVGYRSHTVTVAASQFSKYTLTISGPVGLTGKANGTTITGANNKTPANMSNNTWGYSYGDTKAVDSRTYQSFTGSSQTLDNITTTSTSDTTKNLSFAIKFASNAVSTEYTGKVILSLIATPKS